MPQMSQGRDFKSYEEGKLAGIKLLGDLFVNPSRLLPEREYLTLVIKLHEEGVRHDFHKRGLVAILKAELAKKVS